MNWISKDFWYILLILLALLACLWTLGHTKEYINDCNNFWVEQWEEYEKDCYCNNQNEIKGYILNDSGYITFDKLK